MTDFLSELNDSQREAVVYSDGPQLAIIAGAGSGKTRVLTYKIVYLLQKGMKPWNILALTFTNKAAKEMKSRIANLVGADTANHLYMGTFHSIFYRILRYEAAHIGFTSSFTIYDESDSRSLIRSIIKEMGLDDKVYKPSTVHNRISMAKNHLMSAQEYAQDREVTEYNKHAKLSALASIYAAYVTRCKQANAMDFDDLLVFTFTLFHDNPDIKDKYINQFQYILVDEYQDTNYAQMRILSQLTGERGNICVVGDDSQSIYGFRGANVDNILDFQKQYKNAKLFKLEQNYRSTKNIVLAANSLIANNKRRIPKDIFSLNEVGDKLVFKQAYSDREEAAIVCKDITKIKNEDKCDYNDFAILYRTNAQSRTFEEEMRKRNIPYHIYGGLSFYQRKEIKDIIAYYRAIVNPDDEEAIKRIINYPSRGIGDTTVSKLSDKAHENDVSLWEVISHPAKYQLNVNKGTATKLNGFKELIAYFREKVASIDAYEIGNYIIQKAGITSELSQGSDPESLSRREDLDEFLNGLHEFVETRKEEGSENIYMSDFLQDVSLLTELDKKDEQENCVTLMTVHSAKGLEFKTVFIVGMEDNIFPSPMSSATLRDLEEERRLLYVAITRAEKHCILTCAKNRFRYGRMEIGEPSRFINEIDQSLIQREDIATLDENWETRSYKTNRNNSFGDTWNFDNFRQSRYKQDIQNNRPVAHQFMADKKLKAVQAIASNATSGSSYVSGISIGTKIEHSVFGLGRVTNIEGTGENTKATIEFKNAGSKQLLLKFARFTVVK